MSFANLYYKRVSLFPIRSDPAHHLLPAGRRHRPALLRLPQADNDRARYHSDRGLSLHMRYPSL